MIRAVLDSNILVRAIAGSRTSVNALVFQAWILLGRFDLVISEWILGEVEQTFRKPYFQRRISPPQIEFAFSRIRARATITDVNTVVRGVATHPEDDYILATVISGKADYLVTSDTQLLRLEVYQGVQIVTAAAFLNILDAEP